MARNNPIMKKLDPVIDHRRRQVASLTLRGITMREIEDALAKAGMKNPKTGKPWDLKTVWKDIQFLRQGWREEAKKAMGDHQAQILAKLEEVERAGWTGANLEVVLKAIAQRRALLGTDAPMKSALTDTEGNDVSREAIFANLHAKLLG